MNARSDLAVVHVTVGLDYGGVERALLALAVAQRAAGIDVGVVALRRGGAIADALENAGVSVWAPNPSARSLRTRRGRRTGDAARALHEIVRHRERGRDVVVHSHLFAADVVARPAAAAVNRAAACVTTWHGVVPSYHLGRAARLLAPALYRSFDAVTAVSPSVRASFEAFTGASAVVVPNAVTTRTAEPRAVEAVRARFPAGAGPRIVVVGRLVPEKRVDLVIDALDSGLGNGRADGNDDRARDGDGHRDAHGADGLARLDGARLVIVGDGPLRADLERHARDRGVSHRVSFAGAQPDPEAWLAAADVVAMPSEHEGFGLVALEAAAAGTPLAATRNDGLADVLAGCPAPSIDALTAADVARAIAACLAPEVKAAFRAWAVPTLERYTAARVHEALSGVYDAAVRASTNRASRWRR